MCKHSNFESFSRCYLRSHNKRSRGLESFLSTYFFIAGIRIRTKAFFLLLLFMSLPKNLCTILVQYRPTLLIIIIIMLFIVIRKNAHTFNVAYIIFTWNIPLISARVQHYLYLMFSINFNVGITSHASHLDYLQNTRTYSSCGK